MEEKVQSRPKRSILHRTRKQEEASRPVIEARAVARYVRISPFKARAVINAIRGKSATEAQAILQFSSKKAARIILKVLNSAIANAQNNHGLNPESLYVSQCYVDEGPRLKRLWPRGRGRADILLKRMSHITVVVRDKSKERELSQ
ncbi:MAG: 50S ribosomal protein L22 [Thermotogae bacterium]|nr:50S ribosomal protein L22 [Thermotogota bacterium]